MVGRCKLSMQIVRYRQIYNAIESKHTDTHKAKSYVPMDSTDSTAYRIFPWFIAHQNVCFCVLIYIFIC